MNDVRIHYKSMFSIHCSDKKELNEHWTTLIKKVGYWIKSKYKNQFDSTTIIKPWLFKGGTWAHNGPTQIKAETQLFSDNAENLLIPKYWTLRLQHPDNVVKGRKWLTDISLTLDDNNSINVVVIVSYFTLPGFFGSITDYSTPNAPRVISYLFECFESKIYVGSQKLSQYPQKISIGEGKNLAETIKDKKRLCPIILTRPDNENQINIDLQKLSQILLGNALIYYLEDNSVFDEIKYFFPNHKEYNCPVNAVRVYQPLINLDNPKDFQRHRFFILDDFKDTDEVIKILAQGIFRTKIHPFTDFITSIDDIGRKRREALLSKLKNDPEKQNKEEYYLLLEEENDTVNTENVRLSKIVEDNEDRILELQLELDDNQRRFAFKNNDLTAENQRLLIENSKRFNYNELITKLTEFPGCVKDIVGIIQTIFKEKVIFLPEAIDSAKDCKYHNLKDVWGLLWSMSTILWELYFPDDESPQPNIDNIFYCKTGYELALTEQKQTKKDKGLMALRTANYKGETIRIVPHTKLDDKVRKLFLRVHYHVDREDKVIVIGYCGNHIDTYRSKVIGR